MPRARHFCFRGVFCRGARGMQRRARLLYGVAIIPPRICIYIIPVAFHIYRHISSPYQVPYAASALAAAASFAVKTAACTAGA